MANHRTRVNDMDKRARRTAFFDLLPRLVALKYLYTAVTFTPLLHPRDIQNIIAPEARCILVGLFLPNHVYIAYLLIEGPSPELGVT